MDSKKDKFNKTIVSKKVKRDDCVQSIAINSSDDVTIDFHHANAVLSDRGDSHNINSSSSYNSNGKITNIADDIYKDGSYSINIYDSPHCTDGYGNTEKIEVPPGWTITTKDFPGYVLNDQNIKMNPLYDNIPNKIDKDLVSVNLPYNLKKNLNDDLFYDFAVAGYSVDRISVLKIVNGIRIILKKKNLDDDLIGEEFEFICKGIKNVDLAEDIYIDGDLYDVDKFEASLEDGILSIFVPKKEKKALKYKKIKNKSSGKVNLN
jgi:HSP20 family molecular chaperone IbpA